MARLSRPLGFAASAVAIAIAAGANVALPAEASAPPTGIVGTVLPPDGGAWRADERVVVRAWIGDLNVGPIVDVDRTTGAYSLPIDAGTYSVSFHYVLTAPAPRSIIGEWAGGAYSQAESIPITVTPGEQVDVDAQLDVGAIVSGALTGATGAIDEGLGRMTIYGQRDTRLGGAWGTVVGGRFSSSPLWPGEYLLSFEGGEKWQGGLFDGSTLPPPNGSAGTKWISIRPAEQLEFDVVLDPNASVSGRVMIDDGAGQRIPYADAPVSVLLMENGGSVASRSAKTAADGTYTVFGVGAGEHVVSVPESSVSMTFGAQYPSEGELLPVADGEAVSGIDIVVQRGGTIEGSLHWRTAPGQDLFTFGDADVRAYRLDEESSLYEPLPDFMTGGPYADGVFVSPLLEPGRYALQFASKWEYIGSEWYDNARYFAGRTDIEVGPGEKTDLGQIELEPRAFDVGRLSGPDRFATAVEISRSTAPPGTDVPVVYITNAYKFPDALAAGPGAVLGGGVILPTAADGLPGIIAEELRRLAPQRVVITGDLASISAHVERQIEQTVVAGTAVDRIGGTSRYETAELLVRDAFADAALAVIATGEKFPDALAAGPAASANGAPVILVPGTGALDERSRSLIADLRIAEVVIAGGEETVSSEIESELVAILGRDAVLRAAGANRYETARMVNSVLLGESEEAFLATGAGFVDALAGGALAGALGAPLFLSPAECLSADAAWGLLEKNVAGVTLLGGEPSLSRQVEELVSC
ncbi:cell wall-binding repeat-containing protein [Microbacterium sp. NPDC056569]|uniref:cell wall-binding repeat-containing protein n=1 Tax=Microbacterium sp. NPDC056569 TaxID=3345867 RepID=UPI00366C0CC9